MRCCALCAQVGRVAVVQNSSVYFANLFLNVVERWLYIPLKTICTDFSRNQQKSFESRGSVVRQSHSVRFKQSWNNDSRPQKLDNGSQRQASLRTNWIKWCQFGNLISIDKIEAKSGAYKHKWTPPAAGNVGGIERATAVASTRSARLLYKRAAATDRRYSVEHWSRCGLFENSSFSVLCLSWSEIFSIMSDAAAAPAKAPKKKSSAGKAKKPASHPKYSKMIKDALTALKVRWKLFALVNLNCFRR